MRTTSARCKTCKHEFTVHNKTGFEIEDITLKARSVTAVIKHKLTEHRDILKLKDYIQFAYAFIVAWLITTVFVVLGAVLLLVLNTLYFMFKLAPVILVATILMFVFTRFR